MTATIAFDRIEVETPVYDAVARSMAALETAWDTATDAAARVEVVRRWDVLRRRLRTWSSMVGLRFRQDTRDPERKKAREVLDALAPRLSELETGFMKRLLASEHRGDLEKAFGAHLLDLWTSKVTTYDPVIEAETVEESKHSAAYTELVASARFEIDGETVNESRLGKYDVHPDRTLRRRAAELRWGWFAENKDALDTIFDDLVALRTTQAKKLGFPSYVELGYRKMGRIDYKKDDVARYRQAIRDEVVPLCVAIREQQRQRLGLDTLMAWDEPVMDPQGNPEPQGDEPWMVERARGLFDTMGEDLGGFFRLMADGAFLDLTAREGKAGGGFCTSFPTHGVPFIFANFNGTQGDVKVFTHEMGHAFQSWSSREQPVVDYLWPTADACEVHSMSLEFLTWPYLERFFGDDAERFRRIHLAQSLLFLPYGVAVDHFQHEVYEHPDATPAERHAMWKAMEATYLPWRRWGDIARPAAGGFWQRQLHIYHYPFYYVDYTLAQVCALQFWVRAGEDRDEAMADYRTLCQRGGEAPFQTLVRSAGLRSPFEPGCLTAVVEKARGTLGL